MLKSLMGYDPGASLDVRLVSARQEGNVMRKTITYQTASGARRAAGIFQPQGEGPFAAILYVHWYEPAAPTSNRTQFTGEALKMAKAGAVCLLVETMWSDMDWFVKRTQAEDWENSIRQTIELRQAMDLLLSQPGIDPQRFAYVGHDFGAMYGILAGAADPRPACYVLMAGTPRFPDWYLYYPSLEGEGRQQFIQQMAEIDPIHRASELSPSPLFFQFGTEDPHVPIERAQEFFESAGEPKQVCWYECGHGLDEQAEADRTAWLGQRLDLALEAEG